MSNTNPANAIDLRSQAAHLRSLADTGLEPLDLAYRRRSAELELRAHVLEQILDPFDLGARAAA